jgi:hypothetical protein
MPHRPKLVPLEGASMDTLQCARRLVVSAQDGEVVGAVIGFLYRRQRYSVAVCGVAHENPTWARGVVQAIDDELADLVHERGHNDETLM